MLLQLLDTIPEGCLTTMVDVNHDPTRVRVARTSSCSCSAGGVPGREGATDSAARRPIVERRVRVRGKESAELSSQVFGGKYTRRPGKESRIPNFGHGYTQC